MPVTASRPLNTRGAVKHWEGVRVCVCVCVSFNLAADKSDSNNRLHEKKLHIQILKKTALFFLLFFIFSFSLHHRAQPPREWHADNHRKIKSNKKKSCVGVSFVAGSSFEDYL